MDVVASPVMRGGLVVSATLPEECFHQLPNTRALLCFTAIL